MRSPGAVELKQALPNVASRNPDDGVFSRVVTGRAPKQLRSNQSLFQQIEVPIQSLLDDILQQVLAARTRLEDWALQNLRQMSPQFRSVGRRRNYSGDCL